MNNQKKKLYSDKWSKSNTRDIFNEKQKIAIEKYGDVFEDDMFFALELSLNTDLDSQLSEEFVDIKAARLHMYIFYWSTSERVHIWSNCFFILV